MTDAAAEGDIPNPNPKKRCSSQIPFDEYRFLKISNNEDYRDCPAPGCGAIEVDEALGAVRLPPGVRLDLGGIGKGRAADLIHRQLLEEVEGACVNLGGDLRVGETRLGERRDGQGARSGSPLARHLASLASTI